MSGLVDDHRQLRQHDAHWLVQVHHSCQATAHTKFGKIPKFLLNKVIVQCQISFKSNCWLEILKGWRQYQMCFVIVNWILICTSLTGVYFKWVSNETLIWNDKTKRKEPHVLFIARTRCLWKYQPRFYTLSLEQVSPYLEPPQTFSWILMGLKAEACCLGKNFTPGFI